MLTNSLKGNIIMAKASNFEKYKNCYGFKGIANRLDEYGIWHVQGEDPNCDFGGSHYQPTIGYYEGKLIDIVKFAVEQKSFWTWGAGGNFYKIETSKIDENTLSNMQALKDEKAELEKRLAEINLIVKG